VNHNTAASASTGYTGEYHNVFSGAGVGVPDAAIDDNSNYITFTLVSNATYNVAACQDWCVNGVSNCGMLPKSLFLRFFLRSILAFVNLYYEFWNPTFDFVYTEKSNLVCAAYKVVEPVSKKTAYGGQTLYKKVRYSVRDTLSFSDDQFHRSATPPLLKLIGRRAAAGHSTKSTPHPRPRDIRRSLGLAVVRTAPPG
jgi:hypothetical protein